MQTIIKLKDIATHMDLEPAEEVAPNPVLETQPTQIAPCGQVVPKAPKKRVDSQKGLGVHQAIVSGGKTIPLLKTMLTTACERDCYYCPFRAGRRYRRTTFKPEEMAQTVSDLYRAGLVKGLFLSSGIIGGGVKTQDKLLKTADLLRNKHQYRGFLHLKLMPGVEKAQVARAMELADRLSTNLEAPNDKRLEALAPKKEFVEELLRPLEWVEEIRREKRPLNSWNGRWPSSVTQFVVGGTEESDVEILTASHHLYKHLKLGRTYFSAFRPILDTPLENRTAENPIRQNRLYQASFLFRDYGFDLEEMPFGQNGRLPLDEDPKIAWAKANLSHSPIELNKATQRELLRVPGIGPQSAKAILAARRRGKLRELTDLQAIGARNVRRLMPFVLMAGKRPLPTTSPNQMRLF